MIVGGQLLSLLITLLITPVTYSLFDDLGRFGVLRRLRGVAERWLPWPRRSPSTP